MRKPIELIEGERWLPVPGFEGYYVSDLGRFKSRALRGDFELRGKRDKTGYQMIGLIRSDRQEWFLAHRLVAAVFLDPSQLEPEHGQFLTVNHKDRNRLNNRLDNLELVTVADNNRHWRRHKLADMARGETTPPRQT